MKFHAVKMAGPFHNQTLSVLPSFIKEQDPGRFIYLTNGTMWYGNDETWVNLSSGAGDANESEDMYSDLLRTTIYKNCTYDEFAKVVNNPLIESHTMTFDEKNKEFSFTAEQEIVSGIMFDSLTGLKSLDSCMVSVDYYGTGTPTIQVTADGTNWETCENNKIHRFVHTGNAIAGTVTPKIRFKAGGTGILYSWGILYNKDLTVSCARQALTYIKYTPLTDGESSMYAKYVPGAVLVFLNGELLDSSDYIALDGESIIFNVPLHIGDIVYVFSFHTSLMDQDTSSFIKKDGSVIWNADQSHGNNKVVEIADGTDQKDAVNLGQLENGIDELKTDISLEILKAITTGTYEGDYNIVYTFDVKDLPTRIDVYMGSDTTVRMAYILYEFNDKDLPVKIEYHFNSKKITQIYSFDFKDLPLTLVQTTVPDL